MLLKFLWFTISSLGGRRENWNSLFRAPLKTTEEEQREAASLLAALSELDGVFGAREEREPLNGLLGGQHGFYPNWFR